jgi:dihydrofolate reductase
MGSVIVAMSMSLDGFVAGLNISVESPMGVGGMRLHQWLFDAPAGGVDAVVAREMFESTGAVLLGKRTFDVGLDVWGDTPYPVPCFVLTHEARGPLAKPSGTFTFVNDGIECALRQAKAAAAEKNVMLMGADVARQCLRAGFVDEMLIQLVPVLLGDGLRLFEHLGTELVELEGMQVIESPAVTHLRFRPVKEI